VTPPLPQLRFTPRCRTSTYHRIDVRFVPTGDINCRDCNVRSLVELKFKRLLRKAATRSAETICVIIGEILGAFTPTQCANYFRNSRYAQSQNAFLELRRR